MPSLITVDGGNLAGKDSAIRELGWLLEGRMHVIPTPPPNYLPDIRHEINKGVRGEGLAKGTLRRNIVNSLLYYEGGVMAAEVLINLQFASNPDSIVVLNRSIISTLAGHTAIDKVHNDGDLSQYIAEEVRRTSHCLRQPDLAVFMHIAEDPATDAKDRAERMEGRKEKISELDKDEPAEVAARDVYFRIGQGLEREGIPVLRIYTLGMTPETEASMIAEKMKELRLIHRSE